MRTAKSLELLAACVVAATALVPTAAHAGAYDIFPLEDGNLWVYAGTYPDGTHLHHRVVQVDQEVSLVGNWYVNLVTGLFGSSTWIWDKTSQFNMWVDDGTSFSTFMRFAAAPGASWSFRINACDAYDVHFLGEVGVHQTPAGAFTGTYEYELLRTPSPVAKCGIPGLTALGISEGIGPVYIETNAAAQSLMYAYIDGQIEAIGPNDQRFDDGIETAMILTAEELSHGGDAAELGVAFVVRNTNAVPVDFTFADGQRFEIDVFDNATSEHVRSFSDGMMFTQAADAFTLAPSETRVLFGTLPLTDFDTDALLMGSYQVVGYLTNLEVGPKHSVDIDVLPAGTFGCGPALACLVEAEYCQVFQSGVAPDPELGIGPGIFHSCQPLPESCGDDPSCACLTNGPGICEGEAGGGLTLTIQGA